MTKMMRALQVLQAGVMPEIVEIPIPEPGPGQVRLRTAGSGLCHSDLYVIQAKPSYFPLPLTIGHEPTGWVDAIGPGVKSVHEGDAYALYFPWGCGHCARCAHGHENICEEQFIGPGAGHNGGMADYILVDDPRHLVPLGTLDPVAVRQYKFRGSVVTEWPLCLDIHVRPPLINIGDWTLSPLRAHSIERAALWLDTH